MSTDYIGPSPEVYIYRSDYTGNIRFALRWRDPTSSTGWRYPEQWASDWDQEARRYGR